MALRFLLDEHVARAIQSQLLRLDAGIEVLAVGQPLAPPKGTLDPDILIWIERTGYILLTANRRTIPEHNTRTLCTRATYSWHISFATWREGGGDNRTALSSVGRV
jgi:hypothetical protein